MIASEQQDSVPPTPRAERIAQLNDMLRKQGLGGRMMVTRGVHQLPGFDTMSLRKALAAYDQFDADNDPHGERDFGDLDYCGAELLWKIDYYDTQLTWASPDPADPAQTTRVLTIMLSAEY
jgi:hypothetical protein